ncbi:MAG TPA: S1 RNA-binding domain-containing protein [Actinomycetota bacterium]|nr:S1 RNA-binding domain-containing protein [Actinomycetota bacterium]
MAEVGDTVEGVVERLAPYGAFVALDTGEKGLIHISQVDRSYVKDVKEFLRENDRVTVKVLGMKPDGKLDLSIKALQEPDPRERRPLRRGQDPEFEKMLKSYLRRSNERLADIKRRDRGRLG